MKLTTDQINQIDEALMLNKVVYDDIKLELTDHIASDIEEIMTSREVPYEAAFEEAFEKWKWQFRPSKHWAITRNTIPKIVADKIIKLIKRTELLVISLSVCVTIMLTYLIKIIGTTEPIVYTSNTLFIVVGILLAIGKIRLDMSSHRTTYGETYKTLCIAQLLFLFMMRNTFRNFDADYDIGLLGYTLFLFFPMDSIPKSFSEAPPIREKTIKSLGYEIRQTTNTVYRRKLKTKRSSLPRHKVGIDRSHRDRY